MLKQKIIDKIKQNQETLYPIIVTTNGRLDKEMMQINSDARMVYNSCAMAWASCAEKLETAHQKIHEIYYSKLTMAKKLELIGQISFAALTEYQNDLK